MHPRPRSVTITLPPLMPHHVDVLLHILDEVIRQLSHAFEPELLLLDRSLLDDPTPPACSEDDDIPF